MSVRAAMPEIYNQLEGTPEEMERRKLIEITDWEKANTHLVAITAILGDSE